MERDSTLSWTGEERADLERLRQVLDRRHALVNGLLALFAVMLVATVWAAGGVFLAQNVRQSAAAGWPIAEGVITAIGAEVVPPGKGAEAEGTSGRRFEPRVHYTYQVDGRKFTGDRHRFLLQKFDTPGEARNSVPQYRAGVPISVYYDPGDPSRSLLEPGTDSRVYLVLLVVLAAVVKLWRWKGMVRRAFARTLEEAVAGGPETMRARRMKMNTGSRRGRLRIGRTAD